MSYIILLIGISISGILLGYDSRLRVGKVVYWRVVLAILLTFFATAVHFGPQRFLRVVNVEPVETLAIYAGALTSLWFIILRPKKICSYDNHCKPLDDTSSNLERMDFKSLKKLYYRSCNVIGLAAFILIFTVGIGFMSFIGPVGSPLGIILSIMPVIFFSGFTFVGLVMRTQWGRILGIIVCILALIWIPTLDTIISILLNTIIVIMGLFALFGAPELFGQDRITHKELKRVFKERKKGIYET